MSNTVHRTKTLGVFLAVFLFSGVLTASENVVYGYVVERRLIDEFIGSRNEELVQQVLSKNSAQLEFVQARLDSWAKYIERPPLSAESVLKQLSFDSMTTDNAFAYQVLTQAILNSIGTQLEDTSRAGVMSQYIDLWLDAPTTMMDQLSYKTLNQSWDINRNPFSFPGNSDWPAISYMNASEVSQALIEAEKTPLSKINKLRSNLFEGRGSELNVKQLKHANIEVLKQLLGWVEQAHESNLKNPNSEHYLVLVFDGDQ